MRTDTAKLLQVVRAAAHEYTEAAVRMAQHVPGGCKRFGQAQLALEVALAQVADAIEEEREQHRATVRRLEAYAH